MGLRRMECVSRGAPLLLSSSPFKVFAGWADFRVISFGGRRRCGLMRIMIRPFELLIALRYTRAKRRNHFISFISLSSMLGIALGVAALITVLSVMNGFQKELRERILSVAAHVTITGERGHLSDWQAVAMRAAKERHVI